jgi:hypothetical protein
MNRTSFAIHVAVCIVTGLLGWWLTGVNGLAAAFWCSAALVFNGIIVDVEDAEPGGFDNQDGEAERLAYVQAIKSISLVLFLASVGFILQF